MDASNSRRGFMLRTIGAAFVASVGSPLGALAQGKPELVKILCGYPAGGSVDVVSRKLAERLAGSYGKASLVDNRPGAAGRLAVETLKTSPADGSVLLVTPGSIVTMYPHIYKQLSYDVFHDLEPVSVVAQTAFALAVGPAVPQSVRTLSEFLGWCRANPGSASCGNPGAGSLPHFMALLLARESGLTLIHVPYRGGQQAMLALAGGQVASALATESSVLALVQAGRLRALATSGAERSAFLPDVPTFSEQGYKPLAQREWFGAFMPRNTPTQQVAAAAEALGAALKEPDTQEAWRKLGLSAESSTPVQLQRALRTEFDFWGPIIRASGFTPEA
ncbi:tripartite tricarboxylate transporter substrate-binding protein [Polaromonas jejuensis]|uniref:Tripartite tricarboxylate transporter substrate-binding protein n=1 Tax=Polaromonas jejuensis TaxID=457502 RepID=A0ABW0QIU6_9BURK|nr:tripartite tricarboxylate transporter substrate-binding protein [Polaromonas jejuensis]